ncbi:MAG: glucose-6-phosphate dehydrogenase [Kangiellaceae bacterium]|nr:glucose-6-phosphate dehydrogenase [Kangiellaceae bacterium]MCW8998606.1 glucose-6-phosphate dehydrogenase [Kangiellaceae bacterium]
MKQNFDLVIFGGTGDLSMRKLLPAMYQAYSVGEISPLSRILVCTRKPQEVETLTAKVETTLRQFVPESQLDGEKQNLFLGLIQPVLLDLINLENGWGEFAGLFAGREDTVRLFYLAVAPSIYGSCCKNLSLKNLITPTSRIVVEKPLGYDYETAEEINETMAKYFQEEQIFRIDHYLGKDTVQNLLALRFSNFLFENIWDAKSIDHIQISITEQVGLEGRAGFYNEAGAMRDMVQNHLLQLLCLIAMESPNKLLAEEVRLEKIKVLKALKTIKDNEVNKSVVSGQYATGQVNGEQVDSYLEELGEQSQTETYVAIKAYIENWRWAGVPFYLRTGKRLKKRSAEIIIQFKNVTHNVYSELGHNLQPNRLIIQLQPEEKIQLMLMAKALGSENTQLKTISLDLDLQSHNSGNRPTAYQRLLLDAIDGNSTLFIHRDEVRAAWKWIDPIIESWKQNRKSPELYDAGTWGPSKADKLFDKQDYCWVNLSELS